MRGLTLGIVISSVVSLCGSAVSAGVYGTVWIEVDNSVGTIGETAGAPTGLEHVRTFDLYALATPDTKVFVADFGFVSDYGPERSMWTTQQVYQNEFGGDNQSGLVGALRTVDVVALEFDTYVALGKIGALIVQNSSIFGGDWSPSGFVIAWYVVIQPNGGVIPATVDDSGRIFLARISVESDLEFEDYSGEDEFLGGMLFLSGKDSQFTFGMTMPSTGMMPTANAFDGPEPLLFDDLHDGEVSDTNQKSADLNFDSVIDEKDLLILFEAYGTLNSFYDLTGDGLVEVRDIQKMMILIDGSVDDEYAIPTTAKEVKKAERQYRKVFKKAKKKVEKAEKRANRDLRKTAKRLKKELKRQQREQRRRERKEARNGG